MRAVRRTARIMMTLVSKVVEEEESPAGEERDESPAVELGAVIV